ncbi:MAG TPA: hypothetical protein VMS93_03885 [Candidatus Saccharimonadales bacterium]|nr:hypothetical protein [Candidatus Saccharimonadales bacterium]
MAWAAALLLPAAPAWSALYHVPGDLPSVGAALGLALAGDTVLVAPGTWSCSADVHTGVTLLGDGLPGSVVLDAGGQGAALRLADANGSTLLSNLVLTGGTGTLVDQTRYGGGLYAVRSSAVLSRVRITGCSAAVGGGAYFEQGAPALRGCQLDHNQGDFGAGLALNHGIARLDTCSLSANSATSAGGGILSLNGASLAMFLGDLTGNSSSADGGGMYFLNSTANLLAVTVAQNTAAGDGGGIFSGMGCGLSLNTDVLVGNRAARGGGLYAGCGGPTARPLPGRLRGAARAAPGSGCSQAAILGNTFVGNTASVAGGAAALNDQAMLGFVYNIVIQSGGGYGLSCLDLRASLDLRCDDFWHNQPADLGPGCSGTDIASVDPMFCNASGGDYGLCSNSPMASVPCTISGTFLGAYGVNCGSCAPAVRTTTWGRLRRLYGPDPRPATAPAGAAAASRAPATRLPSSR